jgi:hypothetical protein
MYNKMTKSAAKSATTAPATPAPVVVAAASATPAKEKKVKAPKAVEPAAVAVESAAAPVAEDAEAPLADQSVEFLAKLQQLGALAGRDAELGAVVPGGDVAMRVHVDPRRDPDEDILLASLH